MLIFKKILKI